jgi:hypothetical protein
MKKSWNRWEKLTVLGLALFLAIGLVNVGIGNVQANNTAQTLPFSQNWTNIGLITANDDWSNVPGIVGFLGNYDAATPSNVDPRSLLTPFATNDVDVIANQTTPDSVATGGVAEFEIANPTIALNGSGTADAPHIVLYLNTTGQSNIRVSYNARDIDGSADNSVQQINTQYRVGSTGDFINVAGGYIADATTGPSLATLVTPVAVTLPAAANNQPVVEVRIMTTNAVNNDEWVGIDDISVTTSATAARNRTNVDFNGDGRSDYVITRDQSSITTWWVAINGSNNFSTVQWGLASDIETPADFDGDGRTDFAVWRDEPTNPNQANFYIIRSLSNTFQLEQFGRTGDNPRIVGDYDGDGRADPAVYRAGVGGGQSIFFYRPSTMPGRDFVPTAFGIAGDVPVPGDYDGDGRHDLSVSRNIGGRNQFIILQSSNLDDQYIDWGLAGDMIVPGDYDGDGRNDFCVVRTVTGRLLWYILEADGGGTGAAAIDWGIAGDIAAPGDYDGDGRQDVVVWRPNANPDTNFFYVRRSSNNMLQTFEWGQQGDYPTANWYVR